MRRIKRVLGYARVSSAEQAIGTSLQDQQDVIRAYAKGLGLDVTRFYVEAESAHYDKFERREEIQALMRDVREGDLVLVDKIDRWSRDPEFTYRSIREIRDAGASFYAVGDACDPSTPEGDTMLNFRILFAREEHKRIRQRMVGTRQVLQSKGYYVFGLVPPGYRRVGGKGAEKNVLVIHEPEAEVVRRMFALCADGFPTRSIARQVGKTQSVVHDALNNRHYLGELRDAGRGPWIKGRHPAIIDPITWTTAHKSLDRRRLTERASNDKSETSSWWLRDIAVCAFCGHKMASSYAGAKDPGGRRYYFKCYNKCTPRYVRVERAEAECSPFVVARLVELREELATATRDQKQTKAFIATVEDRQAKLRRKRERYLEAFTDGAIDRDELRMHMAKLDAERTRLDAETQVVPVASNEQRRLVLRRVTEIEKGWTGMARTVKRKLIGGLAKSVALAADLPPRFDWFSAEELLRRGTF